MLHMVRFSIKPGDQIDETESPSLVTKTELARKVSTKAFLCFYKNFLYQLTQLIGVHKIRKRAFWKKEYLVEVRFSIKPGDQIDETENPSLVTKTELARKVSTKAFLCFYKNFLYQLTQLIGFHKIRKRAFWKKKTFTRFWSSRKGEGVVRICYKRKTFDKKLLNFSKSGENLSLNLENGTVAK